MEAQTIEEHGLLSHKHVRELVGGVSSTWLWRAERDGRFPRRVYISRQRPVWHRGEVMEYLRDPENWRPKAS